MRSYRELSDVELTDLLRSEDRHAFTEIYNRYWKKLFTAASNKLDDLQQAEDIVQQIFITIWNRRTVLDIKSSLASYLAVSVKYRILKQLSENFKQKKAGDSTAQAAALEVLDNSTQEWLEFLEIKERLSILVDGLPEKCKFIFQLSRDKGYTRKQIATELNISEKTVEWYLGKAIKSLRSGLKSFFISL